jgi:hypothetical protein
MYVIHYSRDIIDVINVQPHYKIFRIELIFCLFQDLNYRLRIRKLLKYQNCTLLLFYPNLFFIAPVRLTRMKHCT